MRYALLQYVTRQSHTRPLLGRSARGTIKRKTSAEVHKECRLAEAARDCMHHRINVCEYAKARGPGGDSLRMGMHQT